MDKKWWNRYRSSNNHSSICGQWQQSSLSNGDAVIMPYIYLCMKVHLAWKAPTGHPAIITIITTWSPGQSEGRIGHSKVYIKPH